MACANCGQSHAGGMSCGVKKPVGVVTTGSNNTARKVRGTLPPKGRIDKTDPPKLK